MGIGSDVGEGIGSAVGAGIGSDVGAGTGSAVGVGTGGGVGALPSSSSHVQPLQSQPGPLSSWAQVIPLISSQVLLPMHVDGHEPSPDGAGVGSDVGPVGAGIGTGVGVPPSSSSHVQPLQSQPGPLSSWAQVIPLISSQVLLPIHVDGHATDTRTRYHAISQPIFRRRPDIGANLYL